MTRSQGEKIQIHAYDGFSLLVGRFFARWGEKRSAKEEKYHAAGILSLSKGKLYCRIPIQLGLDHRDLSLGLTAPECIIRDHDILLEIG
jgi:hypothetical protein